MTLPNKIPYTNEPIALVKRVFEEVCAANREAIEARMREWVAMSDEERAAWEFVVLNYGRTYV